MAQPEMKYPLSREQLLDLYYYMKLTHDLDEQLVRLFRQNKVVGGLYSSLGQEATAIGTAYALESRDWLAPMIRNVGGLLIKGFRPRDIYMQYMARSGAPTGGKDGTSHFGDLKVRHVVSPISMLGDLIPVMTGVAIAGRYLGQKIVTMTWIGDGGTSTGAFHEGMNFAATQRASFVCVVENNQWAYSTPVTRQVPVRNLADRAKAYGIPSYVVDGNDVVAVYQVTKEAVERARAGEGPVLVEAKTMRMKGHAQHDAAEYVPKEMFEYWKARDPIALYEAWLARNNVWDKKTKIEIDARIKRELKEDLEFAEASPPPSPETAKQGVFCEGCHTIQAEWHRPIQEVMPPQASVKAEWMVTDFGSLGNETASAASARTQAESAGANSSGNAALEAPDRPAAERVARHASGDSASPVSAAKNGDARRPGKRSHRHTPRSTKGRR